VIRELSGETLASAFRLPTAAAACRLLAVLEALPVHSPDTVALPAMSPAMKNNNNIVRNVYRVLEININYKIKVKT
jgi:hypothetical protein